MFKVFKINIMEGVTISSLAMKLFLNKYYDNNIPRINKASIYKDIKQAYHGGITEVYKPFGKDLYYYDVNSLYPYAALNDMPGLICEKITNYTPEYKKNLDNLFGFFYCKIKTKYDLYLPILPVRTNKGLEYPLGEWEAWYFSEEIKFAAENGYEIEIYKGYIFNKVYNVFHEYVDDLYKIKATSSGSIKIITKLLLNSLLGRFGISIFKLISDIVSKEILATRAINSTMNISDTEVLISYSSEINKEVIE